MKLVLIATFVAVAFSMPTTFKVIEETSQADPQAFSEQSVFINTLGLTFSKIEDVSQENPSDDHVDTADQPDVHGRDDADDNNDADEKDDINDDHEDDANDIDTDDILRATITFGDETQNKTSNSTNLSFKLYDDIYDALDDLIDIDQLENNFQYDPANDSSHEDSDVTIGSTSPVFNAFENILNFISTSQKLSQKTEQSHQSQKSQQNQQSQKSNTEGGNEIFTITVLNDDNNDNNNKKGSEEKNIAIVDISLSPINIDHSVADTINSKSTASSQVAVKDVSSTSATSAGVSSTGESISIVSSVIDKGATSDESTLKAVTIDQTSVSKELTEDQRTFTNEKEATDQVSVHSAASVDESSVPKIQAQKSSAEKDSTQEKVKPEVAAIDLTHSAEGPFNVQHTQVQEKSPENRKVTAIVDTSDEIIIIEHISSDNFSTIHKTQMTELSVDDKSSSERDSTQEKVTTDDIVVDLQLSTENPSNVQHTQVQEKAPASKQVAVPDDDTSDEVIVIEQISVNDFSTIHKTQTAELSVDDKSASKKDSTEAKVTTDDIVVDRQHSAEDPSAAQHLQVQEKAPANSKVTAIPDTSDEIIIIGQISSDDFTATPQKAQNEEVSFHDKSAKGKISAPEKVITEGKAEDISADEKTSVSSGKDSEITVDSHSAPEKTEIQEKTVADEKLAGDSSSAPKVEAKVVSTEENVAVDDDASVKEVKIEETTSQKTPADKTISSMETTIGKTAVHEEVSAEDSFGVSKTQTELSDAARVSAEKKSLSSGTVTKSSDNKVIERFYSLPVSVYIEKPNRTYSAVLEVDHEKVSAQDKVGADGVTLTEELIVKVTDVDQVAVDEGPSSKEKVKKIVDEIKSSADFFVVEKTQSGEVSSKKEIKEHTTVDQKQSAEDSSLVQHTQVQENAPSSKPVTTADDDTSDEIILIEQISSNDLSTIHKTQTAEVSVDDKSSSENDSTQQKVTTDDIVVDLQLSAENPSNIQHTQVQEKSPASKPVAIADDDTSHEVIVIEQISINDFSTIHKTQTTEVSVDDKSSLEKDSTQEKVTMDDVVVDLQHSAKDSSTVQHTQVQEKTPANRKVTAIVDASDEIIIIEQLSSNNLSSIHKTQTTEVFVDDKSSSEKDSTEEKVTTDDIVVDRQHSAEDSSTVQHTQVQEKGHATKQVATANDDTSDEIIILIEEISSNDSSTIHKTQTIAVSVDDKSSSEKNSTQEKVTTDNVVVDLQHSAKDSSNVQHTQVQEKTPANRKVTAIVDASDEIIIIEQLSSNNLSSIHKTQTTEVFVDDKSSSEKDSTEEKVTTDDVVVHLQHSAKDSSTVQHTQVQLKLPATKVATANDDTSDEIIIIEQISSNDPSTIHKTQTIAVSVDDKSSSEKDSTEEKVTTNDVAVDRQHSAEDSSTVQHTQVQEKTPASKQVSTANDDTSDEIIIIEQISSNDLSTIHKTQTTEVFVDDKSSSEKDSTQEKVTTDDVVVDLQRSAKDSSTVQHTQVQEKTPANRKITAIVDASDEIIIIEQLSSNNLSSIHKTQTTEVFVDDKSSSEKDSTEEKVTTDDIVVDRQHSAEDSSDAQHTQVQEKGPATKQVATANDDTSDEIIIIIEEISSNDPSTIRKTQTTEVSVNGKLSSEKDSTQKKVTTDDILVDLQPSAEGPSTDQHSQVQEKPPANIEVTATLDTSDEIIIIEQVSSDNFSATLQKTQNEDVPPHDKLVTNKVSVLEKAITDGKAEDISTSDISEDISASLKKPLAKASSAEERKVEEKALGSDVNTGEVQTETIPAKEDVTSEKTSNTKKVNAASSPKKEDFASDEKLSGNEASVSQEFVIVALEGIAAADKGKHLNLYDKSKISEENENTFTPLHTVKVDDSLSATAGTVGNNIFIVFDGNAASILEQEDVSIENSPEITKASAEDLALKSLEVSSEKFDEVIKTEIYNQVSTPSFIHDVASKESLENVDRVNVDIVASDDNTHDSVEKSEEDFPVRGLYSVPTPKSVDNKKTSDDENYDKKFYERHYPQHGDDTDYYADILKDQRSYDAKGGYSFNFETSDGTKRQEQGKRINGEEGPVTQEGEYSFVFPTGEDFHLSYVANENGFQPESDWLPIAPAFPHPIPQFVLRQIEKARLEDLQKDHRGYKSSEEDVTLSQTYSF